MQETQEMQEMQETRIQSLGWEDSLQKEMATHSSILAWRLPCTEDTGGLQSMGPQKVKHMTKRLSTHSCIQNSLNSIRIMDRFSYKLCLNIAA